MIDPRVGRRPYRIAIWRCRPPAPWWDSPLYLLRNSSFTFFTVLFITLFRIDPSYIRKESFKDIKDIGMFWLQVHVWCYWAEFQVSLLIYISRRIPVKLVLDLASRPARPFCQSQSEAESRKLGLLHLWNMSSCLMLICSSPAIISTKG